MPIHSPEHTVYLKKNRYGYEIDAWCKNQFGEEWSAIDNHDGKWCCFWAGRERPGYYRWQFTNEQDMVLFLLRWS